MVADVEKAIRSLIIDASIVGSRVYAQFIPEKVRLLGLPSIVYSRISSDHQHHMTAASGLVEVRIQLDIVSKSYTTVKGLADQVREALDGFSGAVIVGGETIDISSLRLDAHRDDFDRPTDGSDKGYHRVIQDYLVWYAETIPTFA